MTLTEQELARQAVAKNSTDLTDELELQSMLGLMDAPGYPTELWLAACADNDCTFCHHALKGGGLLVEAPRDWEGDQIIRRLDILGHTCESGQKFAQVAAIVDMWSELIVPDIRVG